MAKDRTPPPLTHGDVEEIVADLERALDDHRAWFKAFQAMLVCRTAPDPLDLKKNGYLHGGFKRWYRKKTNAHLRNRPDFQTVLDHHKDMHEGARSLAESVREGETIDVERYQAFVRSSDRFTQSVRALHGEARVLLSYTDPLTGVATRFAMVPRLEQERERSRRSEEPCSIGMMDLDRFKPINDTYGHRAGDAVLQEVARYLLEHLRQYDQVYRYGGEEFVLVLPDTPPHRAKRVLDRLRRGLKRQGIRIDDDVVIHVSASFGIAVLLPDIAVRTAIDRADKALYAAKAAGRNRVCIWGEEDGETDIAPHAAAVL